MTAQTHTQTPLERLRHHVTGAIERGESVPVVEIAAPATHTRGPWEVSRHATPESCPQFGVYAENGNGHDLAHVVFHGTTRHAETEANARLIAAAPDLLEALKVAAWSLLKHQPPRAPQDPSTDASHALSIASAAIAKAEGRAGE